MKGSSRWRLLLAVVEPVAGRRRTTEHRGHARRRSSLRGCRSRLCATRRGALRSSSPRASLGAAFGGSLFCWLLGSLPSWLLTSGLLGALLGSLASGLLGRLGLLRRALLCSLLSH